MRSLGLGVVAMLLACSSKPDGRRGEVGVYDGGSAGASGGAGVGNPSGGQSGTVGTVDNALTVEVEDIDGMTIEIVTLACAGDCADIEAVAHGGNDPYTFEWEDGSTDPQRRVCLERSAELAVSVTDTAITTDELGYEAQTVSTTVSAAVLDCSMPKPDASVPGSCGENAVETFQLFAKVPTESTAAFIELNGILPDYVAPSLGNAPMAIVAMSQHAIELGTCTKLLLAGDAAGTAVFGWDDSAIVEYRSAPGAPVEKRAYYGAAGPALHQPTEESLATIVAPTVSGFDLDPLILNPLAYGWEPLAIDLMALVPAGVSSFELTIYVLDAGNVGSTTEVWVIPQ